MSGVDHPGARLLWAAQHDRLEVARELLELEPSLVTFRDEDEYTALHRAAYSHHHNMLGGGLLTRAGNEPSRRLKFTITEKFVKIKAATTASTMKNLFSMMLNGINPLCRGFPLDCETSNFAKFRFQLYY